MIEKMQIGVSHNNVLPDIIAVLDKNVSKKAKLVLENLIEELESDSVSSSDFGRLKTNCNENFILAIQEKFEIEKAEFSGVREAFNLLRDHSEILGNRAAYGFINTIFNNSSNLDEVVFELKKLVADKNLFPDEEDEEDHGGECTCDGCVDPFYVPNPNNNEETEGLAETPTDELDKDEERSVGPAPETK